MLSKTSQRNQTEVDVSQLQQLQKQQLQVLSQYSKFDANAPPLSLLNLSGNTMLNSQPIALIPVIVPVIPSSVSTSINNNVASVSSSSASRAASLKRQRGVKFDETHL